VRAGKASAAFFENKAAKKLLIPLGNSDPTSTATVESNIFCGAFFKKATA
jgi:hypothetical protein